MLRNIVLAIVTLAVLAGLIVGYVALVGTPRQTVPRERTLTQLSAPDATSQPLRIQDTFELPPGGMILAKIYDPRTGQPTDLFQCRDWRPVPGSNKEISVSAPLLELRLPSGMIATISADEGQLSVDRIQQSQMKPKQGWLAGQVELVIDRATALDRAPRSERPDDLITIRLDRLDFDLEVGALETASHVAVHSAEFDIAGRGLHLLWNQADNRVESLVLDQGERFALAGGTGLLPSPETSNLPATNPADAGPQAAASAPAARRRHAPRRPATTYRCTLSDNVVASHLRGDTLLASLEAGQLELLFDVGGTEGAFESRPPASAPSSAPASQPQTPRDRLEVRWSGPLRLEPIGERDPHQPNRRQIVAAGQPVTLRQQEREVRCGRLEYHDETQRAWLAPTAAGVVDFGLGPRLSARCTSVYIERPSRIIKLIGPVELRSRRENDSPTAGTTLSSSCWAELHLAANTAPTNAPDSALGPGQLESASFVGDVAVALGGQALSCQRLDVHLRPMGPDDSFERAFDHATASGGVLLRDRQGRLTCAQLELDFATDPADQLYPRRMAAWGAARITQDDPTGPDDLLNMFESWLTLNFRRHESYIAGDRLIASLAPPPVDAAATQPHARSSGPAFVLQQLDVIGRATLRDPRRRIAADGARITAEFSGNNDLERATVSGVAPAPGRIHATGFTVSGPQVRLDRRSDTLAVDGASRLAFNPRRSLQGIERSQSSPIVVTSRDQLRVDGRGNTIRFVGDVVASSADENLKSDTLTLLMEDVAPPASPPPAPRQVLWRQLRTWLASPTGGAQRRDPLAVGLDRAAPTRKEPVRLVAGNALVTSETFAPGTPDPILHASISAPQLEVDIVNRQIFTTGGTKMLMLDRRGLPAATASQAAGPGSALLSRGPSQTALQCDGRMTYTLGAAGPDRQDTVVLEDGVLFVHRTGREMVDLEQMLPDVRIHPELLETLESRNATLECERLEAWFSAEEPAGRRNRGGLADVGLRIASLLASQRVYLRDQEGTRIREVNADRVEFSRPAAEIAVYGGTDAEARVYLLDSAAAANFGFHHGRSIQINLRDGTIRSENMSGEVRR